VDIFAAVTDNPLATGFGNAEGTIFQWAGAYILYDSAFIRALGRADRQEPGLMQIEIHVTKQAIGNRHDLILALGQSTQ